MNIVKSLIDYSKEWGENDVVFFTANQVVKRNGELVMGAGNALAAKIAVKGSSYIFGQNLGNSRCMVMSLSNEKGKINLGALATKQHFKDPSNIGFVTKSLRHLYVYAKSNPDKTIHLPYPAIGYGGLSRKELDPILVFLPNNVLIYSN